MCGIVGVIKSKGKPVTRDEHEDFLAMLEKAEQRGSQATGVIYVYESGSVFCMKSPSKATLAADYIPHRENVRALLGHTRQSTGGVPATNSNNHPHETHTWALIHNGSCWTTVTDNDLGKTTSCDTEEFVRMFDLMQEKHKKKNLQYVLRQSLNEMNGSWALAFVNKKTHDIFLTGNGTSPLNCVYFPDGMFFASVASYFEQTLRYCEDSKVELLHATEKGLTKDMDTVFQPEDYNIYRLTQGATLVPFTSYVKTKRTRTYSGGYGRYNGWEDEDFDGFSGAGFHHGGRRNNWNNRGGTPRKPMRYQHTEPPLFTKEELQVAADETFLSSQLITTEEELFKYFDEQLDLLQIDFCLGAEEFSDPLLQSQEVLQKIAIHLVENEPTRVGLNAGQAYNLRKYFLTGHWMELPEFMNNLVTEAFNKKFVEFLTTHINESKAQEVPEYAYRVLEGDNTTSKAILHETTWEIMILCCFYGIYFTDDVYKESKILETIKIPKKKEEKKEGLNDSPFACVLCEVKRKMRQATNGITHHICPTCGSVVIEHPNNVKRI